MHLRYRHGFITLFLLCTLGACSSKPASDADYHHAPLGWTMPIPRGWRVLPADEVAGIIDKGTELMEKSLGQPIDATQTELLYLKRGKLSVFTSALQRYEPVEGVSYAQAHEEMIAAVLEAYRHADIPFRHARERETVDGVEFTVLSVTLLARNGKRIVADQRLYDALIGDFGLTVSLTTHDLEDRDTLLAAWRASRFQRVPAHSAKGETKPVE